jgi:molybdate transport system substrate-binding protein
MAGDLVASGEAEIAFQQISELRAVKGIDYVGPLPASAQRVSVFSAGIAVEGAESRRRESAPRTADVRRRARIMQQSGLDPIAPQ